LAKLYRRFRFDVLHCHSVYPAGYVATRHRAMADVPIVITSHCGDVCPSSRLLKKSGLPGRYSFSLRRADAAVAISGFVEQRLRELCPEIRRVVRLPNGADVARYSRAVKRPTGLSPGIRPGQYFLFLGRLAQRKGADLLLDAFALSDCETRPHLAIAGDGPEKAMLRCRASELGIGAHVHFVGQIEGVVKTWLLQNALCTVIPSRISEGFPLVLLESYAAGRPVIGTQIPGLRELIRPGQTGMLVAPESPAELGWVLRHLVSAPGLSDRLGAEARRFAQKHDWDDVARSYVALFAELAEGRRGLKVA
jgi:glycosyltransferase involved in cell wall biosynthesis